MLADATTSDRSMFDRDYDACVIGTGPAGITVARQLARAGARVALMEAGGLDISMESQSLYEGEIVGLDYFPLDTPRLRYFGGTSNHWGGWCRALESYDFVPRSFEPLSGWPIGRVDLDPYAAEADTILDIPPESDAPDLPITQEVDVLRHIQLRFSPPTRFNSKYRGELIASQEIDLVINANLVDLRLDDALGRVTSARFRSYAPADPGFDVRARYFVLCTGGIENPRLLLNFTSQVPEGIGNRYDLVGRHFSEHPNFSLADAVFVEAPQTMQFFAPTEAFMWREEVMNFRLKVQPNPGLSVKGLTKAATRDIVCGNDFLEKIVAIMKGDPLKCFVGGIGQHLSEKERLADFNASIHVASEQVPNPDSRVMLGEGADAMGLRPAVLDWQLTETDFRTMSTAITTFGQYLAEQNLGRIQLRDWVLTEPWVLPGVGDDEVGGNHHMGTTRMASDPRFGVVDADCRVHGLDNLYIGGSSVFATTGHCNPTYTITQLALRMGAHLTGRLAA